MIRRNSRLCPLVKEGEKLLKLFFRCRELLLLFLGQAVKGIVSQLDLFVCGDLFLLGHLFQGFPGGEGRKKSRNICQRRVFRFLTGFCHWLGFRLRFRFRYGFCHRLRFRFGYGFRFRLHLVFCLDNAFLAQEGTGVLIGYIAAFLRVDRMVGT